MNTDDKSPLDEAVEDLAGELQTTLYETGRGGTTAELTVALSSVMSAVVNVQEAVTDTDASTYPGWFATNTEAPPAMS